MCKCPVNGDDGKPVNHGVAAGVTPQVLPPCCYYITLHNDIK
jgi:hypothetical protein